MAQSPRAKQIISLHFSVDYAYLYILYTSHFKQLSLPFSVDFAYLYILYTSYFKQLLHSVDCKLWVSIFFVCDQVIAYDHSTTATEKCLWTLIAYDHSTTATEKCLWTLIAYDHSTTATEKCLRTHPFENRTKLSPFVSRGSNLYRAPQGKGMKIPVKFQWITSGNMRFFCIRKKVHPTGTQYFFPYYSTVLHIPT